MSIFIHSERRKKSQIAASLVRCKTASASQKRRLSNIHRDISLAGQNRLIKEVKRPKILIEDYSLDRPKPVSYFIKKSRENFVKKSPRNLTSTVLEEQKSLFGPMLSNSMFRKHAWKKFSPLSVRVKDKNIKEAAESEVMIPDWLVERPDYHAAVKKFMMVETNVSEICAIPPQNRNEEEKEFLSRWLSSVCFFTKLPQKILKETAEKLTRQIFDKGEVIIQKGDTAECVYIIYSGSAELYLESGVVYDVITCKNVIGEHALNTLKPRTATVVAVDQVVTFKLTKIDYDTILLNVKKAEKKKNIKLLMGISFFKDWSYLKIQHLSNYLIKKYYRPGEVIFDKGQDSDTFYIIKSGQVDIQAFIELKHINKWPTDVREWRVMEVKKKYHVKVCSLKKGFYFGETSLIEQVPRSFRAISVTNTTCLNINKDEFFDIFSVKDLETLQDNTYTVLPSDKDLEKKLLSDLKTKKCKKEFLSRLKAGNI